MAQGHKERTAEPSTNRRRREHALEGFVFPPGSHGAFAGIVAPTVSSPLDRRSLAALVALWAIATALNVGKPYHIDDTYYLEQARWIAEHPGTPTSGLVYWEGDRPEPFHRAGNHPFLVPAIMALVIRAAGESPLALHLLTAAFSAIAIALVHVLSRRWAPERALTVTSLFALGPAFLAEQNVMLDVPLVAAWLAFFVALEDASRPWHLWSAAAVAALALLIKLTSVALLVVLALGAVHAVRARGLGPRTVALPFVVPLAALGAWCGWGVIEHGEVPLLASAARAGAFDVGAAAPGALLTTAGLIAGRAALLVVVLGAVVPGLALLSAGHLAPRARLAALVAAVLLFVVGRTLVLGIAEREGLDALLHEPAQHTALRALFFVGGLAVLAALWRRARVGDPTDRRLAAWIAAGALVSVLVAPFIASRHVLLILPPVLVLAARAGLLDRRAPLALALTGVLGVCAAVADHRIATVYAEAPRRVRDRAHQLGGPGATTYFVGHWGWQHHATEAGLLAYVPDVTHLRAGDVVVEPEGVHAQRITRRDRARLELVALDVVAAGPLDLVRTVVDREGLYCSWLGLPWSLRTEPLERFRLLRARAQP